MNDPDRLLTSQTTSSFDKELLESWSEQGPSEDARRNVLGLAGAAAAAGVAAATTSIAPKALGAGVGLIGKWLSVGLAMALVVSTGVVLVRKTASPPTPSPPSTTEVVHASSPRMQPTPQTQPAPFVPSTISDANRQPVQQASVPSATVHPHTPPTATASHLAVEIALLDQARQTLAGGGASKALATLDDYDHQFPNGALAQEAQVLRIEALDASGDHAGARTHGDRFLAAHPTSPHARHVREVLGTKP